MNCLIVDDEPLVLQDIMSTLHEAAPGGFLKSFTMPSKAICYVRSFPVDVAFLDIELGSINGIALAKELKDIQPDVHIIFVTSYEKYAVDAFQIHANGYLLKPVTKDAILRELTFFYKRTSQQKRIQVQTFGGFDIFVDGRPLIFKRSKAKELLAYLVDRRGIGITAGEACAALWEDAPNSVSQKSYYRTILAELKSVLKEAGIQDILTKNYNRISINTSLFDCDSYRFLQGDPQAVNSYRHDYLCCYSWSEFTIGVFESYLDK